jgi:membrane protein DedA with SNARE-associated domain
MGILSELTHVLTDFISASGYPGIIFLMTLESMIVPVPSEAVMPFAGFLIVSGRFGWWGIIGASTLGSIIGSGISYLIGAYGGRACIDKYGKYFFLNHHHLDVTEQFFARRGELTVFICRFIPIVRHLISLPAGTGKMNIGKFLLYTTVGAGLWNLILTYAGYALGNHWDELGKYTKIGDVLVIAVTLVVCGWWIRKVIKKRSSQKTTV